MILRFDSEIPKRIIIKEISCTKNIQRNNGKDVYYWLTHITRISFSDDSCDESVSTRDKLIDMFHSKKDFVHLVEFVSNGREDIVEFTHNIITNHASDIQKINASESVFIYFYNPIYPSTIDMAHVNDLFEEELKGVENIILDASRFKDENYFCSSLWIVSI